MKIFNLMAALSICLLSMGGLVYCDDGVGALLSKVRNTDISASDVVADMKTRLGLSDDQARRVLPIIEAQTKGMKELIDELSSGDITDATLEKMQALKDNTDKGLSSILTPQQMTLWNNLLAQGQEKASEMMKASGIGQEN